MRSPETSEPRMWRWFSGRSAPLTACPVGRLMPRSLLHIRHIVMADNGSPWLPAGNWYEVEEISWIDPNVWLRIYPLLGTQGRSTLLS